MCPIIDCQKHSKAMRCTRDKILYKRSPNNEPENKFKTQLFTGFNYQSIIIHCKSKFECKFEIELD